jgi:hypothetical protein
MDQELEKKIEEARQAGYSDEEINQYIQSLNQTQPTVQADGTMQNAPVVPPQEPMNRSEEYAGLGEAGAAMAAAAAAGTAGVLGGANLGKRVIQSMFGGNAPATPPTTPPPAPVAPASPRIQVPQSVGSGPRPVGPVAPTPGAPAPLVRESVGMRNMPAPQPNAINGGNTYLQRMAVLAESVAPTLGRVAGTAGMILMPGNVGQQIDEEAEIRKRRANAKVK